MNSALSKKAGIEKTKNSVLFSETEKTISPSIRIRSTDWGQTEERNRTVNPTLVN